MSFDITPQKARSETDENLTLLANHYRSDSGAHLVVTNEIKRRAEIRALWRKIVGAVLIGIVGLIFWWLRG
jgi:hypothetical protein